MQFVTPLSIIATSHLNIPGRPPSHSIQLHKVLRPPQLQAPWNIIVFVNKKSIFKTIMTTVAVVIMIVDNGVIDAHDDGETHMTFLTIDQKNEETWYDQ